MTPQQRKKYAGTRFPGGRTLDEMEALCVDAEREFGASDAPTVPNRRPLPKPRRTVVGPPVARAAALVLPPDLLRAADRQAKRSGVTRERFLIDSLRAVLAKPKPAAKPDPASKPNPAAKPRRKSA